MSVAVTERRHQRGSRRRPAEQGLSLIELLLSLAILGVLIGFLAGGLSMGRRAFAADRISETQAETDTAIQVVSNLIGTALPITVNTAGGSGAVAFSGGREKISFVGLSEGRSLKGGPQKITLRRSGSDLVVEVAVPVSGTNQGVAEKPPTRVVVLSGVRDINFQFFGGTNAAAVRNWRADWSNSDHLPDLVSIRVDFDDERRNGPAAIVALRQG
jgi:prepilin-type N-terminal cleavage/methylation domain-containing protein